MTLEEFLSPEGRKARLLSLSSAEGATRRISGPIFGGLSTLTLEPGSKPGEVKVSVTVSPVLSEPFPYRISREGRREIHLEGVDDYIGRMLGKTSRTFALDEGNDPKVLRGTLRAGADF